MSHYLFDDPTFGIILALVVETIALLGWVFARSRVKPLNLLAGPALACLFLLADWAVATPREQMELKTHHLVRAAARHDANLIVNLLSDDLQLDNGMDKQRAANWIRATLAEPIMASNKINKLTVTAATKQGGVVEFDSTTRLDPKGRYGTGIPFVRTSWRVEYVRQGNDGYKISNFRMLKFNQGEPVNIFSLRF